MLGLNYFVYLCIVFSEARHFICSTIRERTTTSNRKERAILLYKEYALNGADSPFV